MKIEQVFIAKDGTKFTDRYECVNYENSLASADVVCYDKDCNVVDITDTENRNGVKIVNILSREGAHYLYTVKPFKVMPPCTKGWYMFFHDTWYAFDETPNEVYTALTEEAKYMADTALCVGKFLEMQLHT